MMKAGSETGSLMNHVMSRGSQEPTVGMPCTILLWTDRHAGTVMKVTKTQVHVRECIATRTDTNGMSDQQEYSYAEGTGPAVVFRLTKRGWRNKSGNGLSFGHRNAYHDFSF